MLVVTKVGRVRHNEEGGKNRTGDFLLSAPLMNACLFFGELCIAKEQCQTIASGGFSQVISKLSFFRKESFKLRDGSEDHMPFDVLIF